MDLTQAEQSLVEKAAAGAERDYSIGDAEQDDPAQGASWDATRTVRAEVLRRLCLGLEPKWPVDPRGVRIRGAKIAGDLDLDSATIAFPLEIVRCYVAGAFVLRDARSKRLVFSGSWLSKGLKAPGVTVEGDVYLSHGFSAKGEVRLPAADIGGNLDCSNGTFRNPDGHALFADGMTVKGGVFLREGFNAKGQVRLLGAEIGGALDCTKGSFENQDGPAISADRMIVKGGVFLREAFTATGEVRLLGADIGGNLDCSNGTFRNPDGHALFADGMTVKGGVFLREGFNAKGQVRLLGAEIGGALDCTKGSFEKQNGYALNADGIIVKGGVFLREGFSAAGEVSLLGAEIGGNLECTKCTFKNPSGNALSTAGVSVKGSVFLRQGFNAKGQVRLLGAKINGSLICRSARFDGAQRSVDPDDALAFSLEAGRVIGVFSWRDVETTGKVKLGHARVGGLWDRRGSWPKPGALELNGFEYDEFAFDAPTSAAARKDWLKRQEPFLPQPYEQAIRVLRRMGHDRDAREIAIAKQVALRESGRLTRWGRTWNHILEITVSYGYEPWRALRWAIAFWLLGITLFDAGFRDGLMSPADSRVFLHEAFIFGGSWLPPDYPRFIAPLYSLDVFLPIVDLHQESRWLPNMRNGWGWALWGYMWFHIAAGWVLTSVFVAALTGLIKKD